MTNHTTPAQALAIALSTFRQLSLPTGLVHWGIELDPSEKFFVVNITTNDAIVYPFIASTVMSVDNKGGVAKLLQDMSEKKFGWAVRAFLRSSELAKAKYTMQVVQIPSEVTDVELFIDERGEYFILYLRTVKGVFRYQAAPVDIGGKSAVHQFMNSMISEQLARDIIRFLDSVDRDDVIFDGPFDLAGSSLKTIFADGTLEVLEEE